MKIPPCPTTAQATILPSKIGIQKVNKNLNKINYLREQLLINGEQLRSNLLKII